MSLASTSARRRSNFSEINITPLTDVFLVLLVIMFLIAPLLDDQSSLKITPPSAQSATSSTAKSKVKSILIEISKTGTVAVNGKILVDEKTDSSKIYDKLYNKIVKETEGSEKSPIKPKIRLKADDGTTHGRVVAVYDAVSAAKDKGKIGQLVLVTTKKSSK